MYIFFDVETTGLSKHSEILELAAICANDNLEITNVYHKYYYTEDEVPSGAAKVHGLTRQRLEFLANTDFITDAENIYDLFDSPDVVLVGHNVKAYDLPVLKNALNRCGYDLVLSEDDCIDTLLKAKADYKGKHDLESAVTHYLNRVNKTKAYMDSLFSSCKSIQDAVIDPKSKFHSALYDTFATYVLYMLMG